VAPCVGGVIGGWAYDAFVGHPVPGGKLGQELGTRGWGLGAGDWGLRLGIVVQAFGPPFRRQSFLSTPFV
jgi:hypothetical protein